MSKAGNGEEQGQSDGQGEEGEAGSSSSGEGDQAEAGGSSAGKGDLERSTKVFDPGAFASRQEQVPNNDFERPSVSSSDRTSQPDEGEALVDYRDVFATYQERATAATQDRYIPLDLKDLVKDYFSALDPSR
jgi:hypothetical protein